MCCALILKDPKPGDWQTGVFRKSFIKKQKKALPEQEKSQNLKKATKDKKRQHERTGKDEEKRQDWYRQNGWRDVSARTRNSSKTERLPWAALSAGWVESRQSTGIAPGTRQPAETVQVRGTLVPSLKFKLHFNWLLSRVVRFLTLSKKIISGQQSLVSTSLRTIAKPVTMSEAGLPILTKDERKPHDSDMMALFCMWQSNIAQCIEATTR